MNPIPGYYAFSPGQLAWQTARPMQIPYAELLEPSKSEILGARLWRLPPKSANTWHRHIKAEEFYFVLEGTGKIRIGEETLTIEKHGGVLVGPASMRQIFNDTDADVLWLILGAPDRELEPGEKLDFKRFWPEDPKQLPKELAGVTWPPPKPPAS